MRKAGLLLLLLLLVPLGVVAFLVSTEQGLRWLYAGVAPLVPGEFTIASLNGRLLGPLELGGLRYSNEGTEARVNRVSFDWRPSDLLHKELQVDRLHIDGVKLTLPPTTKKEKKPELHDITLPVQVHLKDIRISNLVVHRPEEQAPFIIDEVSLKSRYVENVLYIDTFQARAPLFSADAKGYLRPQGNYPLNLKMAWSVSPPGYTRVIGDGTVSGEIKKHLALTQQVASPFKADLRGAIENALAAARWDVNLQLQDFKARALNPQWPQAEASAQVMSKGGLASYSVQGWLNVSSPEFGQLKGDLVLHGSEKALVLDTLKLSLPDTEALLSAQAKLTTGVEPVGIEASVNWQSLAWPLSGEPKFASPQGAFRAQGTLNDYRLHLETDVAGQGLPEGHWMAEATGSQDALVLSALQGETLGGVLKATGKATWKPAPAWNVVLEGEGINPGVISPSLPGELAFKAASQGSIDEKGIVRAEANIEHLTGALRHYPINAQAQVKIDDKHYLIPKLIFSSGSAKLEVAGEVQERWDVTWHLDAPDLSALLPDGDGSLRSKGSISGPREAPRVSSSLTGKALAYQDNKIAALDMVAEVYPLSKSDSKLKIEAKDLQFGARAIERIALQSMGNPDRHQLSASVKTPQESLDVALSGKWAHETWDGQLTQVRLQSADFGLWKLEKPVPIQASATQAQLGQLCWVGKGRLCAKGSWRQAGDIVADLSLRDIPLGLSQPFLPEGMKLDGTVDGDVSARYSDVGLLEGQAILGLSPGLVVYPVGGDQAIIKYRGGDFLRAMVGEQGMQGTLKLDLVDAGKVEGSIHLPQFNRKDIAPTEQAMEGKLRAHFDELGLLSSFVPDLKKTRGRVDVALDVNGSMTQPKLHADVDIGHFKGVLRGQSVDLDAQIQARVDGDNYFVSNLDIQSGSAHLTAKGGLQDRWDVSWRLNAPDLKTVYPDAGGSLRSEGKISGPRAAPQIVSSIAAQALVYQGSRIAALNARASMDLQGKSKSELALKANDLKLGTQVIERIALQGAGNFDRHQLSVSVKAPKESLELALNGKWARKTWDGELTKALLQATDFGRWKLEKPVPIQASATQAQLGQLCWVGKGRLCAKGSWRQAGDIVADLSLRDIPLGLSQPFLPEGMKVTGAVAGDVSGRYSEKGVLTGTAEIDLSPGSVAYPRAGGEPALIKYQGGKLLKATAGQSGAQGAIKLTLMDLGNVEGSISLPQFNTKAIAPAEQTIKGKVRARFNQLDRVASFVPALEKLQGLIDVDLDVANTVAQPKLGGYARFSNGAVTLRSAGINVQNINFEARSADGGQKLEVAGRARSGKGQIQLSGQVTLRPEEGFPATIQIKGERFEALHLPEATALVSPDLSVQTKPGRIEITGEVQIPEANITPHELGGERVVRASKDVVIVNKEEETKQEAGLTVSARVRVALGDKIKVDAFGFKGRIEGSLLVIDQPQSVTTGTGELQIIDGTYKAYGQDLTVATGRVIFGGGPIENPGLEATAVRKADDGVTAGVRVRGTLKKPELVLFSEPPMDQANALAYLLLGHPLKQASGGEGDLLYKAASTLGLKGGDLLAKRIGSTFGLEEVGIEAESGLQSASLVLGKYLSPRFYIQYGVGLFDASSRVRIRYDVTKRFSIQTETGAETGADILYTIER